MEKTQLPVSSTAPGHNMQSKRLHRGILISLALFVFWRYVPIPASRHLPCRSLPGAEDTVVIMKTGATELIDRLPPHLDNTLRCPPHSIIFSDHEEIYEHQGKWRIRDVLVNVDPRIKEENPDFALYRYVREFGRGALSPEDLTGVRTKSITSSDDKLVVAGWVLDKWKFVPMMTETYATYPDKKWYVFIESDTYLFWSTTLKYVSTLNHKEPHILGHRTTFKSPYPFMQGGSGYVLSHAALRQVCQYIEAHSEELDHFLETEWAGDIALGYIFNKLALPMTYSWPIFQPSFYGMVDFGQMHDGRHYWCYPAASFHHVTPEAIEDLWSMEQTWLQEDNTLHNPYHVLRLGDVFNNVILPRMRFQKTDWDNQSKNPQNVNKLEDCKQICLDDETCLQYSFDPASLECKTSDTPKYGEADLGSGIVSDWVFERIEQWRDTQPRCVAESFLYYGDVDEDL